MNKYKHVFLNAIAKSTTYRMNFILKFMTVILDTVISIFMWSAIYKFGHTSNIAGISAYQMIAYLLVVNLLSLIFSPNPIYDLSRQIRSGNLTMEIIRPVNLLYFSFTQYIGTTFPFLIIYLLLFFINLITNPVKIFLSLIAVTMIYIMFFLLITFISLCGFWLIQVWPLRPIFTSCFLLLGGQLFPLQVLPKFLHWTIYNPFALAGNQMALISMGKLSFQEIICDFLISFGWSLALMMLIKIVGRKGLQKFEGVGS